MPPQVMADINAGNDSEAANVLYDAHLLTQLLLYQESLRRGFGPGIFQKRLGALGKGEVRRIFFAMPGFCYYFHVFNITPETRNSFFFQAFMAKTGMMQKLYENLPSGWKKALGAEISQTGMHKLEKFLQQEAAAGTTVYPQEADIFNALNLTPFEKVEVVILGQDPYHGSGQAHGLAFSVQDGVALPPSLVNIYKEIEREFGVKMPRRGDLTRWARQGVLLLNATLTVRAAQAGSHQKKGWEEFTDAVIRVLNKEGNHIVFILWGAHAQKKGIMIDRHKHLVLEGPHPSPLSAYRGFFGCGHFKKANEYLEKHGRKPIDWAGP